jgi:hypothetical protein
MQLNWKEVNDDEGHRRAPPEDISADPVLP